MEDNLKALTIKFDEKTDVVLNIVEDKKDTVIYRTVKHEYDLKTKEKSTLTITLEVSPLTEKEIQKMQSCERFLRDPPLEVSKP
jgi:hypothetical protein